MLAATNNKHKLEEISAILKELDIDIISMQQAGIDIEVEEK